LSARSLCVKLPCLVMLAQFIFFFSPRILRSLSAIMSLCSGTFPLLRLCCLILFSRQVVFSNLQIPNCPPARAFFVPGYSLFRFKLVLLSVPPYPCPSASCNEDLSLLTLLVIFNRDFAISFGNLAPRFPAIFHFN